MSGLQNGRAMDQPSGPGGSVRRARERAEAQAELRRTGQEQPSAIPRLPIRNPNNGASRPQAPATKPTRDGNGNVGLAISRPTPVPQWPLAGPIASPASSDGSAPYRPPPGKSQAPQRPPRPSRVPSMLDSSRVQDHTPVFQYTPQNQRVSELSIPETPATASSSRPTTQSSVGSIPDFPLPMAAPPPPPPPVARRSVNLGPPPSSRRGASSFYSMASYVSPIPEESPRARSHTSYASSAAIPDSFGNLSPSLSQDGYYDETIAEESIYSDDADERGLVRSASIGRKGKPSIVTTRSSEKGEMVPFVLPIRPNAKPVQASPFSDGTAFLDGSSSSSGGASSNKIPTVGAALTADTMLGAFQAASATDPSSVRNAAPSPRPFRLSAIRRPPRLDLDAVRLAEARGSLTSLPDLIRRATRLAAMIDKGRRPASRFDLDVEDTYARDPEKDFSYDPEKHQSGFSDMLAAFPPPAQANNNPRRSIRQSIRQSGSSWPLPLGNRKSFRAPAVAEQAMDAPSQGSSRNQKKGRRCCGLPLWGFLLLMFILACIITAAIVVPLEFFVIRKQVATSATAQPALSDCQSQLTCANGGTNVITQGVCSCICSNGFTGTDCTVSSSQGCTTSTLSSTDSNLMNATLGEAIPRLVQQAQANFSIPLSATTILSKFNSANLSCIAENALVTFNGESSSVATAAVALAAAFDSDLGSGLAQINAAVPVTVTIQSGIAVTLTVDNPQTTGTFAVIVSTLTEPTTLTGSFSTIFRTTIGGDTTVSTAPASTTTTMATTTAPTTAPTTTTTSSTTTSAAASTTSSSSTTNPATTFTVTDEVLDFARVAVLFVLQEESLADATTAQTTLQKFFTNVGTLSAIGGVMVDQARNLTIGGGNTVDLIDFLVNLAT